MPENTYAVPPNFPNGLAISSLARQMKTVWPADLHSSTYTHRGGGPGSSTGTLTIETPRAITAGEDAAALAAFQVSTGVPIEGLDLADLGPADESPGHIVFCVDVIRPIPVGGAGTLVYSDGTDWRRVSNDTIATT